MVGMSSKKATLGFLVRMLGGWEVREVKQQKKLVWGVDSCYSCNLLLLSLLVRQVVGSLGR